MYDPCTMAFQIRYPWKKYSKKEARGSFERNYRESFITVWHVDPERREDKIYSRGDDTCGWHTPNPSKQEWDDVKKLGEEQYTRIFERQHHEKEGASYAYICNMPTAFEAVYWSWRAIQRYKKFSKEKVIWQYGVDLSYSEMQAIICLASNPNDNLKHLCANVKDAETFVDFFMRVYRAYLREHRPWYAHPRWHLWHWKLQCHPWQTLRRFVLTRCCKCGKRFPWNYSPVSSSWDTPKLKFLQGEKHLYHSDCSNPTSHGIAKTAKEV